MSTTKNAHQQYLADLEQVVREMPSHNPLLLARVLEHLEHWGHSCRQCRQEATTHSLPEAERFFDETYNAYLAEKFPGVRIGEAKFFNKTPWSFISDYLEGKLICKELREADRRCAWFFRQQEAIRCLEESGLPEEQIDELLDKNGGNLVD